MIKNFIALHAGGSKNLSSGCLNARDENEVQLTQGLPEDKNEALLTDQGISEGCSLLHLACQTADIGMVELLLQYGANINVLDSNGRTPLHYCIMRGKSAIAKMLLMRLVFVYYAFNFCIFKIIFLLSLCKNMIFYYAFSMN